jgi:hypothetical protein
MPCRLKRHHATSHSTPICAALPCVDMTHLKLTATPLCIFVRDMHPSAYCHQPHAAETCPEQQATAALPCSSSIAVVSQAVFVLRYEWLKQHRHAGMIEVTLDLGWADDRSSRGAWCELTAALLLSLNFQYGSCSCMATPQPAHHNKCIHLGSERGSNSKSAVTDVPQRY